MDGVCGRLKVLVVALCAIAVSFLTRAQDTAFRSIQRLTNSEVQLRLNSTSSYRINVSTNLTSWEPLISAARQSTQYLDSGAVYRTNRYYNVVEVTGTNFLAGDHIVTEDGEVIVRPVNHAGFVLRWKSMMIYNDPVGSSRYSTFPKADLILVSHSHSDHFDAATISSVRSTNGGVIIAPRDAYNTLSVQLRTATIVLTNGASTNINGVQIEAVPAYNGNHPRGTGNGYVVTIGGKRFYMAGDTGDVAEMRALQNIDVAFLCMNSFTMTTSAAASAARDFRPKILYPYHYSTPDNINSLKRLVGTEHGTEVRLRTWY